MNAHDSNESSRFASRLKNSKSYSFPRIRRYVHVLSDCNSFLRFTQLVFSMERIPILENDRVVYWQSERMSCVNQGSELLSERTNCRILGNYFFCVIFCENPYVPSELLLNGLIIFKQTSLLDRESLFIFFTYK